MSKYADHIEADSLTRGEAALLRVTGFFPWGRNAWINEDDYGTVLPTEDALADAIERAREQARG